MSVYRTYKYKVLVYRKDFTVISLGILQLWCKIPLWHPPLFKQGAEAHGLQHRPQSAKKINNYFAFVFQHLLIAHIRKGKCNHL